MPRHAPALECSAEDRASLIAIAKSGTEESRAVERARIVLRREGIYLQRRRSWCVSTDKEFAPKAADVVG